MDPNDVCSIQNTQIELTAIGGNCWQGTGSLNCSSASVGGLPDSGSSGGLCDNEMTLRFCCDPDDPDDPRLTVTYQCFDNSGAELMPTTIRFCAAPPPDGSIIDADFTFASDVGVNCCCCEDFVASDDFALGIVITDDPCQSSSGANDFEEGFEATLEPGCCLGISEKIVATVIIGDQDPHLGETILQWDVGKRVWGGTFETPEGKPLNLEMRCQEFEDVHLKAMYRGERLKLVYKGEWDCPLFVDLEFESTALGKVRVDLTELIE